MAIRKLITFHLFECSLIFIHTHFPIFVYAHSIIHNLLYLIGNSVGETPHTFWNVVLYCRQWELMLNASLKWWDNEDGSLYMIGSKAHLFLTPYHIFCINTIVNFVAGIQSSNCSPLFPTNSHKTWVLVLEGPHTIKQTTISQEIAVLQQSPEPYNKHTCTNFLSKKHFSHSCRFLLPTLFTSKAKFPACSKRVQHS